MTPFMPPPPCWTARRFHSAGNHTRKLIGRLVGAGSMGAIRPSTSQRAGRTWSAGTHRGSASVTADTGSPMSLPGIELPSLADVQTAASIDRRDSVNRPLAGLVAGWAAACEIAMTANASVHAPLAIQIVGERPGKCIASADGYRYRQPLSKGE